LSYNFTEFAGLYLFFERLKYWLHIMRVVAGALSGRERGRTREEAEGNNTRKIYQKRRRKTNTKANNILFSAILLKA